MNSQIVTIDQFVVVMASIKDTKANLNQMIDEQYDQ